MFKSVLVTILIILLLLVSIITLQNTNGDNRDLTQTYAVSGTNTDRLFSRCLLWTSKTYSSTLSIIQSINQEAGTIEIDCIDSFSSILGGKYYLYTMLISVNEDTVRVQYPRIRVSSSGKIFTPNFKYDLLCTPIKTTLKNNTASLFEFIKLDTPVYQ